jgi:hypothetical protein
MNIVDVNFFLSGYIKDSETLQIRYSSFGIIIKNIHLAIGVESVYTYYMPTRFIVLNICSRRYPLNRVYS